MKVIKIVAKSAAPTIAPDNTWRVWCMFLRGSEYVYGVIHCNTLDEAIKIEVNQHIDTTQHKVVFQNKR